MDVIVQECTQGSSNHTSEEYDLEQKLDLEIRMREGTTKLLAACKHRIQSLEAAKSLLVSNERMSSYLAELQMQKLAENSSGKNVKLQTRKAKVAVSDIRMPLIWKDSDHFKNKGDCRRFVAFCLLKIGTEIYDTALINNIDRNVTDISFEDVIVFNNIPPNFEFHLELYSHILQNDFSIASAPHKIKKKISNSVSRTIGRKLAASLKEDLNAIEIGPKFDLVAHAVLRLSDCSGSIQTHDLTVENLPNQQHNLPLFGHFCCRLAVQPDSLVEELMSGYLSIVQQIGNVTGCRRMWCSLKNCKLSFWTKIEDCQILSPVFTVFLDKNTKLCKEVSSTYSYSFVIQNNFKDKTQEYTVVADSETEYLKWTKHINQHLEDHKLWGHAMESPMDIPSPAPCQSPFFFRERQTSLYEEIPIKDMPVCSGSYLCEGSRRLSSPSFRSRSSSTSSTSSSTSGNRHYPFLHSRKQSADSVFY
ncbi:rhotekin-2-like isoform X2 [Centruroides vittatus]|uniref:rhotekin-2-like isoform X2 n=1 Tax=Centruroides vittatus TaxID=120091 RepID=UPI0035103402